MSNIAEVVKSGLCTGCGTCASVCPNFAIRMHISSREGIYLAEVDESKCNQCMMCVNVCCGYSIDFVKFNSDFFGKQPEVDVLGNYLQCYIGHARRPDIRYNSSSGGVVTQILLSALERKVIDGALVVRMKKDNPFEPEPFIARTGEDILSASKSKYCPVPLNIALREILRQKGKFAVVGLPCHIWGIRAAEKFSQRLRNKIVLHIGLFCSHTVNFKGTEFLLRKLRIRKADVVSIDYRGKGWPGFMSIKTKDGGDVSVRYNRGWNAYWNVFSPVLFTPLRCLMCSDQLNELSDISVGDAWLPELESSKQGESVIIARTAVGEKALALTRKAGSLSLARVPPSKVVESQSFGLNFKKENLSGRLSLFRMLGMKTPHINPEPSSVNFWSSLGAFLSYMSFCVSLNERLRSPLLYVPLSLFRLYFGLFKCIFMLSTRRGY